MGDFPRQTFNQVLNAQRKVRKKLTEWNEENKVIKDNEEEEKFRKILSQATLGLCGEFRFGPGIHGSWSDMYISKVVTIALSSDKNFLLVGSKYDSKKEKKKMPIGYIWGKIKEKLNEKIFDLALKHAAKMSPEREAMKDNMPSY